jgi:hypothetical protein
VNPLLVGNAIVAATLAPLQAAGRLRKECVVLWLGSRENGLVRIAEVVVPEHEAAADQFYIPRQSILALIELVGSRGLTIAAQVHSHPREAFHSLADDQWAMVRHVGALSLVIPWFARRTTPQSFWTDTAVFSLSAKNTWDELTPDQVTFAILREP